VFDLELVVAELVGEFGVVGYDCGLFGGSARRLSRYPAAGGG